MEKRTGKIRMKILERNNRVLSCYYPDYDLKVSWSPMIPNEMRQVIEPLVLRYVWLLPKWLITLGVNYWDTDGKNNEASASSCVDEDYRQGRINIYSSWFDGSDETRRWNVVHEILHFYFNPPGDFCHRLMLTWKEADRGPMWEMLDEERRTYTERSVQDLAWKIIRLEDATGGFNFKPVRQRP